MSSPPLLRADPPVDALTPWPGAAEPLVAAERPQRMCFGSIPITETAAFHPGGTAGECSVYVTLNAEIALGLERNCGLKALLDSPRLRVSVDGQWLWWALRRKYRGHALRKMSGSDLVHNLASHCVQHGHSMFLVGSTERRNALAVARLRSAWPGLHVGGFAPPRFDDNDLGDEAAAHAAILERLSQARPDYVVLGLGANKEHRFAALQAVALDARVRGLLCFGGAIDMASGDIRRAPLAWQRCGLEGLYRVMQQPSRAMRLVKVMRVLPRLAVGAY